MVENAALRAIRLLDLVPYIVSHPGISIAELAREFSISRDEVLKDLNLLFLCGLPGYTPLELIDISFDEESVVIRDPQNLAAPRNLNESEALIARIALAALEESAPKSSAAYPEIDEMGGVVAGIHKGYFRRQIAEASYRFGQEMEAGDRMIVGVNAYTEGNEERNMEILQIPHTVETEQCDRLGALKRGRNNETVLRALDRIRHDAREGRNVMAALVEASLSRCTLGEMVQAMADVYGRYAGGPEW